MVFVPSYQEVRGRPLLTRTSPEPYANAATPFVTAPLLDSRAITGPAVIFGGVRECVFELLLPHPLCGQPRRLVRLRRALEQPDRGQHAPTGVDQVVAAEPRQLAEPRQQAVANLSRHFLGAHLVDPLVAAHSRIHVIASISLDLPAATPETGPPDALKPCV